MPYTQILARAYFGTAENSKSGRTPIVVGLVCGMLAIGIGLTALIRRTNRSRRHGRENLVAQAQQSRRENNGWWGATPTPTETAAERRRRNLQVRATMGGGPEIAREARSREIMATMGGGSGMRSARRERVARDGDPPPMYQLPAPAYYANPEWRRQNLTGRRDMALSPLPLPQDDAPPAYESPPVWPTGVRIP